MSTEREMPKYKCHKEVYGLKINKIEKEADGGAIITATELGYEPFKVNQEYMDKHKPLIGGYYVVYKGGYKSFSPAKEFEDGYTKIN